MPFIGREQILRRLRKRVAAGQAIIGAGAGTGISAKFAERGGVDLIIIYNSGRFRMAGRGSLAGLLPYGDANAIVVDMRFQLGRQLEVVDYACCSHRVSFACASNRSPLTSAAG